jgi:hypothetical protein
VIQDQDNRVEGRDYASHPRENISWYQAIAFCRWLSWRLGGGYDLAQIDPRGRCACRRNSNGRRLRAELLEESIHTGELVRSEQG